MTTKTKDKPEQVNGTQPTEQQLDEQFLMEYRQLCQKWGRELVPRVIPIMADDIIKIKTQLQVNRAA